MTFFDHFRHCFKIHSNKESLLCIFSGEYTPIRSLSSHSILLATAVSFTIHIVIIKLWRRRREKAFYMCIATHW